MLEYANDPDFAWVGADGKAHEEAPGIRARAALNDPAAEALFAGSRAHAGGHPPGSGQGKGHAARLCAQDSRAAAVDQ